MRVTHLKRIFPIVTLSMLSAFEFWGCTQGENPEVSSGELSSVHLDVAAKSQEDHRDLLNISQV